MFPYTKRYCFNIALLALIMILSSSSGFYQNEDRLCKRIRCGTEVSRKICPIKCHQHDKELRVTSFPSSRRLIMMGDDKMCMKHSDCPKSFPVCMPGPFTQELLSNDQQKEFFFVGRCKTLRCKTEADCKDNTAGTMLMHSKMKCVHKDNQNKKDNNGFCVQMNRG